MKRLLIWSIIATGISSIPVQLINIREFLTQFHGNEITISMVLFCWLLLTGIGSLVAKRIRRTSLSLYAVLCAVISLWPLLQLIIIRAFRDLAFIHGVSPGFYGIFFYIFTTTAPYCLLIGFILPYALGVIRGLDRAFTSGDLYIKDNIGDILGGLLFTFVLVTWVKPFKSIAITSCLLIVLSLWILWVHRRYVVMALVIGPAVIFLAYSLNHEFELSTLLGQYGTIVRYQESPYGRIIVTKEGPQRTLWESGIPFYTEKNIINSEEKVHYALSQRDRVEGVLLVSGGLGETLDEVYKYNPKYVDYVELDPYMTDAAEELGFIRKYPGLTILNTDGRMFMRGGTKRYDAIIIDLPDPDTFQINRFYTEEFYSLCKALLNKEGVLSFGLEYSPNYISEVRRRKLSIIYNTARRHFQNVLIVPGNRAYYLCRDGALWEDIPSRLRLRGIQTSYVEGFYYGNVTRERMRKIRENLAPGQATNRDFEPRVMNIVFKEWFSKHGTSPRGLVLVLGALTLLYAFFMKREEYVLFSTGLVTMGIEMLVIFTFQVIYGYVYLKIGAIITAFLLGLLPGAIAGNIYKGEKTTSLALSEVLLLVLLFLFFLWINYVRGIPAPFLFLAYCFVFSFFCGLQFPTATAIIGEEKSPAAGCLAADMAGAALGTLVTGCLLVPFWGIKRAVIFLMLMKLSSIVALFFMGPGRGR
ncbi:MAG: hypothetical protein JRH06_15745 [Deltaproteobacteria bacterium]|nr:hypothetical protein [Deltaproteobacteria bacterium]MBW2138992.1 hypothetical protein [Deltaproteobacteria bacterium]